MSLALPHFPDFKPLEITDRDEINRRLWDYQPETSELTFTNLFIWRKHYDFQWCLLREWLIIGAFSEHSRQFYLPPIGPLGRLPVVRELLFVNQSRASFIQRADEKIVSELTEARDLDITPARDHFDYLYSTVDLINLSGNRYHAKRNHISSMVKHQNFQYLNFNFSLSSQCLALAETWCGSNRCQEDLGLSGEFQAIKELLENVQFLKALGSVILVDDRLAAFSFGEMMNSQTAVIHIEKADPNVHGLYALINQQFCEKTWSHCKFINREQDLGSEGLRKAKESYHPVKYVKKYDIARRKS